MCLSIDATGRVVEQLATGAIVDCSDGVRLTLGLGLRGDRATIQPDLSFAYTYSGPLPGGSSGVTDIQATYRISGRFTTSGDAGGLVAVDSVSFGYGGKSYACTPSEATWTATVQ
jgi:hypothetical protein